MLCITVAQDGSGDFASISEAVLAVPYDCPAQIRIGAGIYREKLVCEKKDIALQGAGADCTRLVWGDGGKLPHPDGRPTHTFRSYTAFFSGERLRVEDLTIENDAGPGAKAGQAVAAYVDSAHAVFEKVRLLGNQDTLDTPRFCRRRVRTLCLPWDALDWYSRNAAFTARRTVRADSFVVEIIMLNAQLYESILELPVVP